MNRNDRKFLEKMLSEIYYATNKIKNIEEEDFLKDEDMQRIIVMTLINIGELAKKLSKALVNANPHIPFNKIVGLRNMSAHEYFALKFKTVWLTAKQSLPELENDIRKILKVDQLSLI